MRRVVGLALALLLAASAAAQPAGALFSKRYRFKPDVRLEIGAVLAGGLRVDTVHFTLPGRGASGRGQGPGRAEVAVSNDSDEARRVGIAVALFDEQGRLLGVSSGGSRFLPIKPDRQGTYTLVFDDVNTEIHRAVAFHLSVEPR